MREHFFTAQQLKVILSDSECHQDDRFGLERAIVKHYDCDLQRPICLYDFTLKNLMLDFLVFRVNDIDSYQHSILITDYFYSDKPATQVTKYKCVPIYHGYHICKTSNFTQ